MSASFNPVSLLAESHALALRLRLLVGRFISDQKSLEEHAGPLTIVFFSMVLLVTIILVNVGLFRIRQTHLHLYNNCSLMEEWRCSLYMQLALIYLWLSPVLGWMSLMDRPFLAMLLCPALAWSGSMKDVFLFLWVSFIGDLASAALLSWLCDNPRFTAYKWAGAHFQYTYLVIMGVGLASLLLLMIDWLSACFKIWPHTGVSWPLLLCALYFGVLSQQLAARATRLQVAEVAAQPMATAPGACDMCFDSTSSERDSRCKAPIRKTTAHEVKLSCQHCFHKVCIRSCILFGNKDCCPLCDEKVNLRDVISWPCLPCHHGWVMLLGVFKYIQVLLASIIPCGLVVSICMTWIVEITVYRLSEEAATSHSALAPLGNP